LAQARERVQTAVDSEGENLAKSTSSGKKKSKSGKKKVRKKAGPGSLTFLRPAAALGEGGADPKTI